MGHLPVNENLACLDEFGLDSDLPDVLDISSATLGKNDIRISRKLICDSESMVQNAVGLLLEDIIQLLNLVGKVVVLSECSITNEVGSKHTTHKADFLVVYLDGRPILVVKVMIPLPGTTFDDDGNGKLTNLKVLG